MSGGQSSLRTAVLTLGFALVLSGSALLLRGAFTPTATPASPLMADNRAPRGRVTASVVSLGMPEGDDVAHTSLKVEPTQLLSQLEDDDLPPPPPGPADPLSNPDPAPTVPRAAVPEVELLDAQPSLPTQPDAPAATIPPFETQWLERNEQQLARIASGIEGLSRQSLVMLPERIIHEPAPARTEVFCPPPERDVTALIKIERIADDRDRFSLEARQVPIPELLHTLCDLAGLKLELAHGISGRVTVTIREVTLGEAINAVLQQADLGVEREEHRLRVMPRSMAEDRATQRQPLVTKRYPLQSARAAELLPLVRPLLTPRVGRMTVMPVRSKEACPPVGLTAPAEILVIVDRDHVHDAVTRLLSEVDRAAR